MTWKIRYKLRRKLVSLGVSPDLLCGYGWHRWSVPLRGWGLDMTHRLCCDCKKFGGWW